MRDQTKNRLSVLAYFSMFVLPPVGFLIGWIGWNIRIGIVTASILFTVFFLLGGLFLVFVENSTWFSVSLPLIGATIYTILPDFLPGPIDDTIVMTAGSLLTFVLWLRKQPETPKWIIFPLIMASLYTLVGVSFLARLMNYSSQQLHRALQSMALCEVANNLYKLVAMKVVVIRLRNNVAVG